MDEFEYAGCNCLRAVSTRLSTELDAPRYFRFYRYIVECFWVDADLRLQILKVSERGFDVQRLHKYAQTLHCMHLQLLVDLDEVHLIKKSNIKYIFNSSGIFGRRPGSRRNHLALDLCPTGGGSALPQSDGEICPEDGDLQIYT